MSEKKIKYLIYALTVIFLMTIFFPISWHYGAIIHANNQKQKAFNIFRKKADALLTLQMGTDNLTYCYKKPYRSSDSSCTYFANKVDDSLRTLENLMPTSATMHEKINIVINRKDRNGMNTTESTASKSLYHTYLKMLEPDALKFGYKDVRDSLVY